VFFIVLDLRLTKVGVQRNSFFYALFRVIYPFVFVRGKTPLRSIQNELAFELKRPCIWSETPLRFISNVLAFFWRLQGASSGGGRGAFRPSEFVCTYARTHTRTCELYNV